MNRAIRIAVIGVLLLSGCAPEIRPPAPTATRPDHGVAETPAAEVARHDVQSDGSHRVVENPRPTSALPFDRVTSFDVVESDGSIHLLLGRPAGDEGKVIELCHARSDDGGATWSDPVALPTDHARPARLHRGDDPQLAARGSKLIAIWPAKGQGPFGSGPLGVALSDDAGRTWRPGPTPAAQPLPVDPATPPKPEPAPAKPESAPSSKHKHAAPPATGPGFRFPAAAAGDDSFHVVWIYALGEERSLRHARLDFAGAGASWSDAVVIDPRICACCWNELKVDPAGSLCVLYRDISPSDMATATSADRGATWQAAGRPGPFGWQFDGCPHVGGGLAGIQSPAGPTRWVSTVWTGAASSAGAYATAQGQNTNWENPIPLGSGGRNTDLAASPKSGLVLAVWDQSAGESGQTVLGAFSLDGGATWGSPRQLSAPGQNAAYPRVVPTGDGFFLAWTVYGAEGKASLATRTLPAPASPVSAAR